MKILFSILVFFFTLMILGCSDDGTLKVSNDTNANVSVKIDGKQENISANSSVTKKWSLSKTLFSAEEKSVDVNGEGLFKFYFTENAKVEAGKTEKITIHPDAGGLEIDNNSNSSYIYAVYISPSSATEWGNDQLSGTIGPGGYVIWRVTPGSWDVLVVDDQDRQYVSSNKYISANQLLGLSWVPVNTMFKPYAGQKAGSGIKNPDMLVERIE